MTVPELFAVSFAIGLSGAATPGPLLLVTIAETAKYGALAAVLIVAGHAILELAATAGLSLGLLPLAENPSIFGTIAILGGAYLGFLSIQTIRESRSAGTLGRPARRAAARRGGRLRLIGIGIVVSLAAPYWTVWWLTVGASQIAEAITVQPAGVPAFYVGHILSDFAWYGAVGLMIVAGGRFLSGRPYRWFLAGCGVFLGAFGAYFLVKGARVFLG